MPGSAIPFYLTQVAVVWYESSKKEVLEARSKVASSIKSTLQTRALDSPVFAAQAIGFFEQITARPNLRDIVRQAEQAAYEERFDQAVELYRQASDIAPTLAFLRQRCSVLCAQNNDAHGAWLEMKQARQLNPDFEITIPWEPLLSQPRQPRPTLVLDQRTTIEGRLSTYIQMIDLPLMATPHIPELIGRYGNIVTHEKHSLERYDRNVHLFEIQSPPGVIGSDNSEAWNVARSISADLRQIPGIQGNLNIKIGGSSDGGGPGGDLSF